MYLFFTLTAGILISLIALLNGTLTAAAGLYLTTVIIHVTAIIFALIILWIGKNSFIPKKKLPLWMYCGGLISVMCTLCSNYAFGKINLIAITALGLLAQAIASLIIDCFGLLGARKRRVRPATWVCIAFSSCGIVYMLYGSEMSVFSAIAASFAAGIGLVVSRVISASLAEYSGTVGSSLINHMIGLPLAVLLLFVVGSSELAALPGSLTGAPAWSYLGGVVGMLHNSYNKCSSEQDFCVSGVIAVVCRSSLFKRSYRYSYGRGFFWACVLWRSIDCSGDSREYHFGEKIFERHC
ncbi:MAG: DMT family transporter [Oscillospiraceae bacterium]